MNQLRPILRGNPTRAQKLVLSSADLDRPPSHGKSQTLAALGLGGSLVATTHVASAVTAVSAGTASAATTTGPLVTLALAGLKGIAAGLVAGSLLYGTIVSVRSDAQRSAHPSEEQAYRKVAPQHRVLRHLEDARDAIDITPTATTQAVAPLPTNTVNTSPLPQTGKASVPTHKTSAVSDAPQLPPGPLPTESSPKAVSSVASQSLLESEIALLDTAQRALAAGQPSVALQNLDTHRRLFAKPHLLPEATLVRIQALLALGRTLEARRLGEQLLAAQPQSAVAQRVRSLIGTSRE